MDGGAWWATAHGVPKSQTRLSDFTHYTPMHRQIHTYRQHVHGSPGSEDPREKGKATPLQYSGLENSMDCTVHGVVKSWTRLSHFQG